MTHRHFRQGRTRSRAVIRVVVLVLLVAGVFSRINPPRPALALSTVPPDFTLNDGPTWFDTGHDVFGSHSLAVALPGSQAVFHVDAAHSDTVHEVDPLIWPADAPGYPKYQNGGATGDFTYDLPVPGLYAFQCTIHPYMVGAVVVLSPGGGADFGKMLGVRGVAQPLPSYSNYVFRLVRTFFLITNTANWQRWADHPVTWEPRYAPVPVLTWDASGAPKPIANLEAYMHDLFHEPMTLPAVEAPKVPGVGEVWVDTQMEEYNEKHKPGASTAVDATTWQVTKKFAEPEIDMNNPHNMWSDKDEKVIYQSQWFRHTITVFDRDTGAHIRDLDVGQSPAHIVTRPGAEGNDNLIIGLNGANAMEELAPGATSVVRKIPVTGAGEGIAHPHAHFLSSDGNMIIEPDANFDDARLINISGPTSRIAKEASIGGIAHNIPIATWMTPDNKKSYTASLMGNVMLCMSNGAPACVDHGKLVESKTFSLTNGYDYVTGGMAGPDNMPGFLPIQTPVSPDGHYMLTANAASGNISVTDTRTDEVVKTLPCAPGCHGINFGAKKGGGYYGYASSKFANMMEVIDGDPNGDGDPSDAAVVGRVILEPGSSTKMDATIKDLSGMGGQGVLPLPLVYNGWVQERPGVRYYDQLTCQQRNPIGKPAC